MLCPKIPFSPTFAVVLGSGLGGVVDGMHVEYELPYGQIPDFPVSTVSGHAGKFLFGTLSGKPTAVMQGRVHYYEGYPMSRVVMPIRLLSMWGVKTLMLTNSAGAITPEAGDIMAISDHINLTGTNPLIGKNDDAAGVRFPDMTQAYSKRLMIILEDAAAEQHIAIKKGVYAQLSGPSFETPAEIRMLRVVGADAVGMSTACEAIAARHCGMEVAALSVMTNKAAGLAPHALTHEETLSVAAAANQNVARLVAAFAARL